MLKVIIDPKGLNVKIVELASMIDVSSGLETQLVSLIVDTKAQMFTL